MKKVYLIGRSGVHANEQILVEGEIVLGRDAKVCQLVYPKDAKKISGTHCKLREINDAICLIDMNSTNGTFFEDGTKLQPNMPRTIGDGQGFYLGNRDNSFDIRIEEEEPVCVESPKKNNVVVIVATIIAVVAVLLAVHFAHSYQQEQNKNPVEKTIDALEAWGIEF